MSTDTSGPWGIWVSGSAFDSLEIAAVSDITAGKTMVISREMACNNNLTITNRSLSIPQGGSINVASGKTLDLTGVAIDAGAYQIFTGAGTVTGLSQVYPEWWGAVADWNGSTGTDNRAAFNAAGACKAIAKLSKGNYYCSDSVTISQATFEGVGEGIFTTDAVTTVTFAADKHGFYLTGQGTAGLRGICVSSLTTSGSTGVGVKVSSHAALAENLLVTKFGSHGVQITNGVGENANGSILRKIRTYQNKGDGFNVDATSDSNACTIDTCDASSNTGYGFAVSGASTLLLNCHSAANTAGDYRENGNSNKYIGCYSESGVFYADTNCSSCLFITGAYAQPTFKGANQNVADNITVITSEGTARGFSRYFSILAGRNYSTGAKQTDDYQWQNHPTNGMLFANATDGRIIKQMSTDDALEKNSCAVSTEKNFQIVEGTNKYMGVATLVAGTVTVNTNVVKSDSRIFLTNNTPGGTPGFLSVSARVADTSFTILSSSGTDTSTIAWMIMSPGTATG